MSIPLRYGTTISVVYFLYRLLLQCQFLLGTVQQNSTTEYLVVFELKESEEVSIPLRYGTTEIKWEELRKEYPEGVNSS